MNQLDLLFKWVVVIEKKEFTDERDFIDQELNLNRHGFKARVEINESGHLTLSVPLKDEEVCRALLTGEVREVITQQPDSYRIFDRQLKYKNKSLYENKYPIKMHYLSNRRFLWIGLLIVILLLLFKFVKF